MIGDYLVVALVFGIAGSFVFILHHFWLRDAFKEEPSSFDDGVENQGKCEINSVLNESSSKAGCQPSRPSIQAVSCSTRNSRKPFDARVTTFVGGKPDRWENDSSRENARVVTNTGVRPVLHIGIEKIKI